MGKRLFSGGQPRSALKQYEKALTALHSVDRSDGRWEDEKEALTSVMQLNSAACHLQMADFIAVLELCSDVLRRTPNHPKALYLRAAAHQAREEWTEATEGFQQLLQTHEELDANTRAKVKRQLQIIEGQLRKQRERDTKKYDGFLLRGRGPKAGSSEAPSTSTLLYEDRIAEEEETTRRNSFLGQVQHFFTSLPEQTTAAFHSLWSVVEEGCRRCRQSRPSGAPDDDR